MSLPFFIVCNRQGDQALTAKELEGDGDVNCVTPFRYGSVELDSTADYGLTIVVISIAISIKITGVFRVYITCTISSRTEEVNSYIVLLALCECKL